jgi:putative hemolysin
MTLDASPPIRRSSPSRRALAQDLFGLPRSRQLLEHGPYSVHIAPAIAIPSILRELGHLRAEAFPGVFARGDVDLDRFDSRYLHLFVWNRAESEIVGGYRLGCVDMLGAREHPERLYTHGQFDYDARFLRALDLAIELGRSFVAPKYRKSFAALHLLWRGIGAFVTRERRYRYLFGALTIPRELPPEARDACLGFLHQLHAPESLSALVRGRTAPELQACAAQVATTLSELEQQLAARGCAVPPLLRHYARLGARTLALGVDLDFGGSVDALVLLDLAAVSRPLADRYLSPILQRTA